VRLQVAVPSRNARTPLRSGSRRRVTRRLILAAAILIQVGFGTSIDPSDSPAVAQTPGRPDILLIVTDDQRADTLAAMPTLREEIGGQGVRFRLGFVPHALCCPARASILTGRYSHTTGVWGNTLEMGYSRFNESSTIATWLHHAGYRTGLFGKYINHWADADPTHIPPGWDEWFAFTENCCSYHAFTASVNGTMTEFDDTVYSTTESSDRAAEFIRSAGQEPLFVMWTPDAPHKPAQPEARYAGAFASLEPFRPPSYLERDVADKPAFVRSRPIWGASKRAATDALRRRMFETLISVDDGVARLIDALEDTGRLSNTLIVFTSDNGVLLGEHRFAGKPFAWNAAHRVPFLVRFDPLVETPTTSTALVLTIDIAPTIAELASITGPSMDGKSLTPILDGERMKVRSRFVIESARGIAPPYCGARSRYAMFVRYATGEEEFYDYRVDPWELNNAARDTAVKERVRSHRRWAREHCSPTPPGFAW
jgi:arylsulfatase A-like enzyme